MKRRHFALGAAAALGGGFGYPALRDWVAGDRDMPGLRYRHSIGIHGHVPGMALTLSADASRVAVLTNFGHDLQIFDNSGTLLRREAWPTSSVDPMIGITFNKSIVIPAVEHSALLTLVPDAPRKPLRYVPSVTIDQNPYTTMAKEWSVAANGHWAIATTNYRSGPQCEIVDLRTLTRRTIDLSAIMGNMMITTVGISADGTTLAIHDGSRIMIVDRVSSRVTRVIDSQPFAACFYGTTSFSPDGSLYAVAVDVLVSIQNEDPVPIVKIFDVQTGALFREIVAPPMSSPQMSWSADGKRLAVSLDGEDSSNQLMLITPHSDAPPTRHHFVQRNAIHFAANAPVFGILRDRWVDLFDCIWA